MSHRQMLRPEEVESLVCGNPVFCLRKLVDVTEYSGYSADDITIRYESRSAL
jgi:hypothetical protein